MSIEHIEVNGHELTAFDLPSEPSETYEVHVDGLGEIVVEKGNPPKEKDVPAMYMRKLVPELCEQNAELHRENAKLRELVGEVASILFNLDVDRCGLCQRDDISHPCPVHTVKGGECPIKSELRDFGIEVDG